MNLTQRFIRFFVGFFLGCLIVAFFLTKKSAKCNYLPNQRVVSEVDFRKKQLSPQADLQLKALKLDSSDLYKRIMPLAKIDFKNSSPRKLPCGFYKFSSTLSADSIFTGEFSKCDKQNLVIFLKIEKK
ncbi:MAG: hypothetical protein C4K58_02560 [Flavobacteriaceae bacterium]|nr:MAG: hypothetical protein C4K58_02560 [Flavobacteriaceae bacterium]